MTLEEFTSLRQEELVAFFKARFGKHWRRVVATQAHMHPRWFERWKGLAPLSMYRQIHKLDVWARSIGFESATGAKVHASLRADREFKEAATQAIEECKRNQAELAREDSQLRQRASEIQEAIREAMERRAKASPAGAAASGN
jgi:hypothetical protein